LKANFESGLSHFSFRVNSMRFQRGFDRGNLHCPTWVWRSTSGLLLISASCPCTLASPTYGRVEVPGHVIGCRVTRRTFFAVFQGTSNGGQRSSNRKTRVNRRSDLPYNVQYGDSNVYYSRIGDRHLRYPRQENCAQFGYSIYSVTQETRVRNASHDVEGKFAGSVPP